MTTIVSISRTTTLLSFIVDDSIVVLPGVDIDVASEEAILASDGGLQLDVEGLLFGSIGFDDASTAGKDSITVGLAGSIIGANYGIYGGPSDSVTNNGAIDSLGDAAILLASGGSVVNTGRISGLWSGVDFAYGTNSVVNSGEITASSGVLAATPTGAAVYCAAGSSDILNSGAILASSAAYGIYAGAGGNYIQNTGTISSASTAILLKDGEDSLVNDGSILSTGGEAIWIEGTEGSTTFNNYGLIAAVNNGNAALVVGGGSDTIYNTGTIRGGLIVGGNYDTVTNRGLIAGPVDFSGDYATYRGNHGSVDAWVSISGAHGTFVGDADGTTFIIGATTIAKTDIFNAQGVGTLEFNGAAIISVGQLANVSGFDDIILSKSDQITITEGIADSAKNHNLTIEAEGGDKVKLNSLTSTTDKITVWGQGGGDTIVAGVSPTTFQFQEVADSTGSAYDILKNVNYALDKFDIPGGVGSVAAINTAVTAGALSTTTFNTDLAADLGPAKLAAHDAVLFTASAGTLAGDTFLVVELNGTAGYKANTDFVMQISGSTGSLTTANFV